jgi:signal peptidase I
VTDTVTGTATNSTTSHPRRPLLALFASLLLPGLGQVYCGEVARGAAFLLCLAMILPAAAWLGLHAPRGLLAPVVVAGVASALAVYVYAIKAAVRSARKIGDKFTPTGWNRGSVYVALFILGHLFVLGPLSDHARSHLVETFKVPSSSMLPAIAPGDRVFADKRIGRPGGLKLERGAIAVFLYPNDRTTMFIKRIVGLPGDTIDIDGTSVKVNGVDIRKEEVHTLGDPTLDRLLDDHIAFRESSDRASYLVLWRRDTAAKPLSVTVPNGHVFVLGDNRDSSHDSRQFGVLPLADVSAVARQVWFSFDAKDGVRWRRTGKLLD